MNYKERSKVQNTEGVQVDSEDVLNTFTCHICDTLVPKTHMRIHLEGDKHQTCLKIADVALERTRRQLHLEIQPLYEQDIHSFYCDPCSIVLLASHKTSHEQSEAHIENVQYYNVLRTFSAFYINREDGYNLKESSDAVVMPPTHYNLKESSDAVVMPPTQSAQTEYKDNSRDAELQEVIKHLKEVTAHMQSQGLSVSLSEQDLNLNKALTGLKLTVDRTLNELQETVARKESLFDKAINSLKDSADKTLHEIKESAEIKHQTEAERSKLAEAAELEIYKFKNKLSKMNTIRKNTKKTNLPKPITSCVCDDDDPKKSKKKKPSIRERVKATFGSPKPNKSSAPK